MTSSQSLKHLNDKGWDTGNSKRRKKNKARQEKMSAGKQAGCLASMSLPLTHVKPGHPCLVAGHA
jgi:hypothetical protein